MPPNLSSGRVCSPYSVTQTGTLRWNHFFRSAPNRDIVENATFGYATFWPGPSRYSLGYGCVAHAENCRCGFACATRCAHVAGATVSLPIEPVGRLRPRFEVSPAATWAKRLPALMPL